MLHNLDTATKSAESLPQNRTQDSPKTMNKKCSESPATQQQAANQSAAKQLPKHQQQHFKIII